MSQTVADQILKVLAAYGVRMIYGVIGDAIFPLADALARQNTIRYIPCAIETTAAFMAAYHGRLSGVPGVCIGTSGPGAGNLVNGTGMAYRDQLPLLCLTGQVARNQVKQDANQYIDQSRLFAAVTAQSQQCLCPATVVPVLSGLLNQAISQQTAVHLTIPSDILKEPAAPLAILPPPLFYGLGETSLYRGAIEAGVAMIQTSKRPLLVIGGEARSLAGTLADFAAALGAGIILTQDNKGALPDRHPLVLGGIGEAYCPACLEQADVILLFGAAPYEQPYFPANAPVLHCTARLTPDFQPYLTLCGDLTAILTRIRTELPLPPARPEWQKLLAQDHQNRIDWIESVADSHHPLACIRTLAAKLAPDAVITLDVGEFVYWFDSGFLAERQEILLSGLWRSMGSGIAAGIAACLNRPGRQVVTLTGDGGFLMSCSELATVVREKLPLTIVVFRNQQYGLEVQKMRKQGLTTFGTDLCLPDLSRLAESFGLKSFQVNDLAQAPAAVEASLINTPSLLVWDVNTFPLPHLR